MKNTVPRSVLVYSLDADGRLQARYMTPDEAEMALRLHMVMARLPETKGART